MGLQGSKSQRPSQVREEGTLPPHPYFMQQQDLGPESDASPGLSADVLGLEPCNLAGLASIWGAECGLQNPCCEIRSTDLTPGLGEVGTVGGAWARLEGGGNHKEPAPKQLFRGPRGPWGPCLRDTCSLLYPSPSLSFWDQPLSGMSTTASSVGPGTDREFSCVYQTLQN